MKILKHGRSEQAKKIRRFDCFYCKCEYEAETGEFTLRQWMLAGRMRYEAICHCPECGLENIEQLLDEE